MPMSDLLDLVLDTFPANGDVSVPLQSNISVTLSGLDYDHDSLIEGFFVEGPDTDQYIGPGLLDLEGGNILNEGELDNFLQSPGYQGITAGLVTVATGLDNNSLVVTFDPTNPLAPSTEYRANLTGILDAMQTEIDGFLTFSFTSGTGSIEEIPSSVSTSVLSAAIAEAQAGDATGSTDPLAVINTTPGDLSVEHDPAKTNEIVVEFNRPLDPASVDGKVSVRTVPATDHPNATTKSQGDIVTSLEVEGKKLKIKI